MRVVVASIITAAHLAIEDFTAGSSSKFASAENEGFLQHAPGFKVMEKGCNGLVHGIGIAVMPFFKTSVLVPEITVARSGMGGGTA